MRFTLRIESAAVLSAPKSCGITSGCRGSVARARAASNVLMSGWPLSVNCAPMPSVSCESATAPTLVVGSRTPGTTGESSPTVAVVSAKNTIDTNVSTSGIRFSSVSLNFENCAARRALRASRARLILCARRGAARLRRERDPGEVRELQPLEHVDEVRVAHLVRRDHGDIGVLRILG